MKILSLQETDWINRCPHQQHHLMDRMASNRIRVDYDKDADVLYISFRKPRHADDSEMEDNLIYPYRGRDLAGIAVIGAERCDVSVEGEDR
jgi:uncharacterized protein YuzE